LGGNSLVCVHLLVPRDAALNPLICSTIPETKALFTSYIYIYIFAPRYGAARSVA
jgi:hypothetical protein